MIWPLLAMCLCFIILTVVWSLHTVLILQNPTWTSVALAAVGEEHNVDLAGKCILFDQYYKLGKQFPSVFSISHLYKTTKPLAEWLKWCDSFRNLIQKHHGFGRNILPDLGLESWRKHSQRNIQSIDVNTHHLSQSSFNDTVWLVTPAVTKFCGLHTLYSVVYVNTSHKVCHYYAFLIT